MANLKTVFQKRIPTILGLVFLLAGLGVAIFMVGGSTNTFFPKASPETTPKNIKVTNITDKTFTISFLTDIETPGYLLYGSEPGKTTIRASDDREKTSGVPQNSTTHHITVYGLNPNTKYYFLIGTASNFKYSDAGQPYEVTTAPQTGAPPEAVTAYGTVLTGSNQPATDAIVYLTMPNGAALSALVKTSGTWAIPLAPARTSDLKNYLKPDDTTPVTIFAQGTSASQTSQTQTTVSKTQPLATLTLGVNPQPSTTSDGDMSDTPTDQDTPTTTDNISSAFRSSDLNPAIESDVTETPEGIVIITIPENGTVLNETQPNIEGTAPANTEIKVKIQSTPEYNLNVVSDENGNFTVTPPADLAEGNHTITLSYKDSAGKTQTVRRTFIVQANPGSGGSGGTTSTPAYTSSPSGSTRATPRPTTQPATSSGSTRTSAVATDSGVPVAGSTSQTALLLIMGTCLALSGFFLSRKLEQESSLDELSES